MFSKNQPYVVDNKAHSTDKSRFSKNQLCVFDNKVHPTKIKSCLVKIDFLLSRNMYFVVKDKKVGTYFFNNRRKMKITPRFPFLSNRY